MENTWHNCKTKCNNKSEFTLFYGSCLFNSPMCEIMSFEVILLSPTLFTIVIFYNRVPTEERSRKTTSEVWGRSCRTSNSCSVWALSAGVVPHTGSDVDGEQLHLHGGEDPAYPGPSWGRHQCQGIYKCKVCWDFKCSTCVAVRSSAKHFCLVTWLDNTSDKNVLSNAIIMCCLSNYLKHYIYIYSLDTQ